MNGKAHKAPQRISIENAWKAFDSGLLKESEEINKKLLEKDPENPGCFFLQGLISQRFGAHRKAIDEFRAALAYSDSKFDCYRLYYHIGISLRSIGMLIESEAQLRLALESDQKNLNYARELGFTLKELSANDEANRLLKMARAGAVAGLPAINYALAELCEAEGKSDDAIHYLEDVYRLEPKSPQPILKIVDLMLRSERFFEARDYIKIAVEKHSQNHNVLLKAASINFTLGNLRVSRGLAISAIRSRPGNVDAHVLYAKILLSEGSIELAEKIFKKAERLDPANLQTRLAWAVLQERKGEIEKAKEVVDDLLAKIPGHPQLLMLAARLQKDEQGQKNIISLTLKRIKDEKPLPSDAQAQLQFSVATLLDRVGSYKDAFEQYRSANLIRRKTRVFNKEVIENDFMIIKKIFSKDLIEKKKILTKHRADGKKLIFVIGMPRSGTTLTEQILSAHSSVYGAGEQFALGMVIDGWDDKTFSNKHEHYSYIVNSINSHSLYEASSKYLSLLPEEALSKDVIVDKMPYNFMHVGFINLIFPAAKIILCERDPRDTILSCYFQDFTEGNAFSYDLNDCFWFYEKYNDLMQHWQEVSGMPIYKVKYEELVSDPAKQIKSLLECCDLNYEESCVNYRNSNRVVHTASYQQVREPIYLRSVSRWKNYQENISELLDRIERSGLCSSISY